MRRWALVCTLLLALTSLVSSAWALRLSGGTGDGGTITDGDKGDISVAGGGTTWTLDPSAVTYAKLQSTSAPSLLLGRGAGSAGTPQEITLGPNCTMTGTVLNCSGSEGGVADGDKGDLTISVAGTVWTLDPTAVTYAKMQNVSAASRLLGRGSASGAGSPQEITLGPTLLMSGTTLNALGVIDGDKGDITVTGDGATWTLDPGAVTYTKLQSTSAAARLLGRGDSGAGTPQEISLGANLSMSGTTLNAASSAVAISGTPTTGQVAIWTNATTISGASTLSFNITDLDLAAATRTRPNKVGTTPPGTCADGDTFWKSDAVAGARLLDCKTNVWTAQGGGTGTVTISGTPTTGQVAIWTSATQVQGVSGVTTTQVADNAVTLAKLADMATASILGRTTSGTGDPEVIPLTTFWTLTKTLENTRIKPRSLTQTDVASIVIDPCAFDRIVVAELSQDTTFPPPVCATGTPNPGDLFLLEVKTTVARVLTFSAATNGFIADSNLALPTLSMPGIWANYLFKWNGAKWAFVSSSQTTTRGTLDECYRSNGSTAEPGFRECIANASITYAKLQNISAASRLLGRGSASGAGSAEEITVGSGLTMTGTTLTATGGVAGTIGVVHLPVDAVKFPTSDAAVVDGSETNARLLFDNAVRKCAYWGPFRMNPDYASAPVFKLQYSMTSVTSGGVAIDVEVMAVTPGDAADANTESYATVNTCVDATVPGTAGHMKEISCALTNTDGVAPLDLTKLRLCRNVAHASDTAAGVLEALTAALQYTR